MVGAREATGAAVATFIFPTMDGGGKMYLAVQGI